MPKPVQSLAQLQVRNARLKEKPYRLFDGGGLYREVTPAGSKLWRMKFRQPGGKENRLSFGVFPEVSLADARTRRDQAPHLLAFGADPARVRNKQAGRPGKAGRAEHFRARGARMERTLARLDSRRCNISN